MTKQEIRSLIKTRKQNMTVEQIKSYSDCITNVLFQTEEYLTSNQIYCYVSFNQEVLTDILIKTALSQDKKVAVPKIIGNQMKFFYINSLEDLQLGYYGILEPITDINTEKTKEAIPQLEGSSLVIVPGLAFDLGRNRIGYGKGYYDRFFEEQAGKPMKKTALTYDFQVLDRIPTDANDKKVDKIITEQRIIL